MKGKEIERKWILKYLPDSIFLVKSAKIEQIYLNTSPEIRLRKKVVEDKVDYKLTVKSSGSLIRSEFETKVDEAIWLEGLASIKRPPIKKDYYKMLMDDHTIKISVVDNKFIYAEVEFESIEEAVAYDFPLKDELLLETTDSKFKMKRYWENGLTF